MRAELHPHPDFPSPVTAIEAEAERSDGRLLLTFRVVGNLNGVQIPPPAAPRRADELWRHTCFEAFVAPASGEAYFEANVSPSLEWAVYRFDGYRRGMTPANANGALCELDAGASSMVLRAEVDLSDLGEMAGPWRLGICAVIEARDGTFSYWALAHPPGRPDFHHADCFALEVPAPQGS
jgi:hypothetical protein